MKPHRRNKNSKHTEILKVSDVSAEKGVLPGTADPVRNVNHRSIQHRLDVVNKGVSAGMDYLLSRVRDELARRGCRGITGLLCKFRSLDTDGSKALDLGEFRKGMKEMNFPLNEREVRLIFQVFDRKGNGTISFDDFLLVLRGKLSEKRKAIVNLAFDTIDIDNS